MANSGHISKSGRILLCTFALLLLIAALAYGFLFRVNRFTLEIRPVDESGWTVPAREEYELPDARVYLVGSIIAREGIEVGGQVHVEQSVDTQKPGDYPVIYRAQWKGLETSLNRMVTVVDITPPRITLSVIPGHRTVLGEQYQEEGYSAWDDCDGDLTAFVTRVQDEEFVTYIVMDEAGNRTSVSRKIYYYDPTVPELTLQGESVVYIKAGEGYVEPGWTAVDNADGDISHRVKVTGQVDKYRAGTYTLTYTVKDESGNCTEAIRTVVVQPVGNQVTVMPEGKVIYLTFDDGPGPYTKELLQILAKYDAKATFFVVDSEYRDVMSDIVKAGHSIGIHSVTHDYRSIYASADAYFHDLLSMQKIIYEETGAKTYLMRFPGGSSNTVSRFNEGIMSYLTKAVVDNGFRYFDWNVDSDDAGRARDAKTVIKNILEGVEQRRISVVLQHDIKDFSIEAVEEILIWGLENGYQFLGLDMTSPTARHGVNN